MKNTIFALLCTTTPFALASHQPGSLISFMKEQNDALPLPNAKECAKVVAVAGAAAAATVTAAITNQEKTTTRGLIDLNPASLLLGSPYLWFALGGASVAFAVYHFIGHEMAIIVNAKTTLSALEKQIKVWQAELPQLKENQQALGAKVNNAVKVLDTIIPLVSKLAKNSDTEGAEAQIIGLKKELADLRKLVQALPGAQSSTAFQAVEKQSHSIFGFGKKSRFKHQ